MWSSMKITQCSYINLNHRTDKFLHISEQLASCPTNIPISRISGLMVENFAEYKVHDYINVGSQIHKGIIGCWMAHKQLIKQEIDKNLNYDNDDGWTLVFEDDVVINPWFWTYLEMLSPIVDTDMIFFDSCMVDIEDKYVINEEFNIQEIYTSFPVFVGTHCYAIKNSSLNKVYNILDGVTIFKDIDGYYFGNNDIKKYNYQSKLIKINYKFHSDRLTAF